MVKVLIVGQTPPPFLGLPIMVECLVRSQMPGVHTRHLRVALSASESDVGKFRWLKVMRLILVIFRLYWARLVYRPDILYFAPAAAKRTSMLRDAAILCTTRFLFPKTVFHYHSSGHSELYQQLTGWRRTIFRWAFFDADGAVRIATTTPEDGKGLHARREFIVPNGIADPGLGPARTYEPASQARPLQLLFVALLCEGKGLCVLIEACGELAARGVPFQLNVMGRFESPEFERRVRGRVAELGIESQVNFLGVLTGDEKFDVFRRTDVFCHPTFYDTFPVVLLEAMACGLPVVSTRWSGIPEIVDDGQTGFLVEPHDPTAVADRVAELAQDVELRREMGAAGRAKFLREFTLPKHVERMGQVFRIVGGTELPAKQAEPQRELVGAAEASGSNY
jgi:glycosyltransferase involved in cell wall biosynthesis